MCNCAKHIDNMDNERKIINLIILKNLLSMPIFIHWNYGNTILICGERARLQSTGRSMKHQFHPHIQTHS